jgi:translation initiation factor 1 (eIF-1/SUI1)
MSRKPKINIDAGKKSEPLIVDAFAALDALDKSRLAPAPVIPAANLMTEKTAPPAAFRGRLILRREKKDRGGKTVVIVSGFAQLPQFSAVAVGDLAKQLRGKLGCGGSFDRHEIMLQGDRPAQVTHVLRDMGFTVDGVTG